MVNPIAVGSTVPSLNDIVMGLEEGSWEIANGQLTRLQDEEEEVCCHHFVECFEPSSDGLTSAVASCWYRCIRLFDRWQ